MFRMRRMTALLMSVLLMGSTACTPAMAAEATGEEPVVVQEEVQQAEAAEPVEDVIEQENSAENVTSKEEEPDEKPLTEEPEIEDVSNAEESAEIQKTDAEADGQAAADSEEPIHAYDGEAVQGDGSSNVEAADVAKKDELSEPVKTDDTDLATVIKEEKTDADAETGAAVSAETVSVTGPLYKIAAPDAEDAGNGRWEEIIETIHHDEQGHYEKVQTGTKTVIDKEAWDEQVYESIYICGTCGYESQSDRDISEHIADVHNFEASYGTVDRLVTVNHPAETHEEPVFVDRWVVDTAAWDEEFHTGRMQYVVNGHPIRDSLVVIEGETYYLDKTGSPATGWMKNGGDWRYFDETGKMQTGWQQKNGVRCYVDEATGKLVLNNAKNVDGTDYYFDGTGAAHKKGFFISNGKEYYFDGKALAKGCWAETDNGRYYFDADGVKQTGLVTVGGKIYPVGTSGALKPSQWVTVNGKNYYTDANGAAVTSWQKINGAWYYFNNDGTMHIGWRLVGSTWYYFNGEGHLLTGLQKVNGYWYYFNGNGARQTSWQKIGNYWYYFDSDGKMHIGWRLSGSTWYYFNGDGHLLTGWQKINGAWYYFNGNGARQTGWQHLGSHWYYFNSDGKLHFGWRQSGGNWYYFDGNGALVTGWQKINGYWYYFNGNGARQTGWRNSGNYWYYFNSDGKLHVGWRLINGSWYYFDKNGAMVTGWRQIGDARYYFDKSGAMAVSTWVGNDYVGSDGKWIPGYGTGSSSGGSSSSNYTGTVYWTPGGSVYHRTDQCPTLKRSTTVLHGTIDQSGKPRPCSDCFH